MKSTKKKRQINKDVYFKTGFRTFYDTNGPTWLPRLTGSVGQTFSTGTQSIPWWCSWGQPQSPWSFYNLKKRLIQNWDKGNKPLMILMTVLGDNLWRLKSSSNRERICKGSREMRKRVAESKPTMGSPLTQMSAMMMLTLRNTSSPSPILT